MLALGVKYHVKGQKLIRDVLIDAKDAKSAKRKIERKINQKIILDHVSIVGYY